MEFENLFSPLTIKGMTLRNRVVMSPMGSNMANPDGSISPEHINYYTIRAKGGTGLIIVENVNVDFPLGSNGTTQLRLDHDRYIPHLYELTENVHRWGGKVSIQINHAGSGARADRIGGMQPVSSGNLISKKIGQVPRPLKKEEILGIVEKYGDAAVRAQKAGFDAVEIHGGHGYLISQFLSLITNNREDEFGGSMANRARFLRMVAEEVRGRVGPRYPVLLRVSADEFVPGGLTLDDTLDYLTIVNQYFDLYDVSAGLIDSLEFQIDAASKPDGWKSYMARAVREKLGKPVISVGNYRDPNVAEAKIARGDTDLIAIGRGLIADPDWCNKVQSGNLEKIRPCISCGIGCIGNRSLHDRPIRCTVNPAVTEGDVYKAKHIKKPCHIAVIGAGTAGLEAACTAAEVGCAVTLIEKNESLGGRTVQIAQLPDKSRIKNFSNYLIHRAISLDGIDIRCGTDTKPEYVAALNPDIIVCATGSAPMVPPIKGLKEHLESGDVFTSDGMIANVCSGVYPENMAGKRVVTIGGGAVGLDVAEYFVKKRADVAVVEMLSAIGRDLDPITACSMAHLLSDNNVVQMTETKLIEVRERSFIVEKEGVAQELPFDYGFVCLGLHTSDAPFKELSASLGSKAVILNIGDSAKAPGHIIDGVRQGRDILFTLEQMGYL